MSNACPKCNAAWYDFRKCTCCGYEAPAGALSQELSHAVLSLRQLAEPALEFYKGRLAAQIYDHVMANEEAKKRLAEVAREAIEACLRNSHGLFEKIWKFAEEEIARDPALRNKVLVSIFRTATRAVIQREKNGSYQYDSQRETTVMSIIERDVRNGLQSMANE